MMMRITDRAPAQTRLAAIGAAAVLMLTRCGSTGTAGTAAGGDATGNSVGVSSAAGASAGGSSSDEATSGGGPSVGGSAGGASAGGPASRVPAPSAPASGVPSSGSSSSGLSSGAPTTTSASSSPSTRTGSVSGGAVAPAGVRGNQFSAKAATGRDLAAGKPITLTFPAAGGTVSINAGCNAMGGKPIWTDSTLTVAPGISTMMACIDPGGGNQRMVQEHWFSQWLSKGVDWRLTGSDLVLSADGVTIVLVRAGSPESHPAVPSAHPPLVHTNPTSATSASVSPTTGAAPPSPAHSAPVVGPTTLAPGVTAPSRTVLPGVSIHPPPITNN